MATEVNYSFQLGETWEIDFQLNDEAGDDLDLQAGSVSFRMSLDDEVVLDLSSDSPTAISLSSPAYGNGVVTIAPEDQTPINPGSYNYEVRAELADGRITVQGFGKIIVGASLFAWPLTP